MHVYLYEPRPERAAGLTAELASAGMEAVLVGAEFFAGDLGQRVGKATPTRPFLLAATEDAEAHLRALRRADCRNAVFMLRDFRNARAAAEALDAGADDDLVIPLKAVEFRARINAVNRRAFGHAAESVEIGEVTAFFDGRDPQVAGQRVKLSRREHAIFQHLALNADRVVPKSAIYDAVYGMADDQPFDKVIDVYICKIRKKLAQAAPSGHQYIETVYGRGYKFAAAEGTAPVLTQTAPALDGMTLHAAE